MSTEEEMKRERMAENAYSPLSSASAENRQQHSLDYIAFYLGEISDHLGQIAQSLHEGQSNSTKMSQTLLGIQAILPRLLSGK